MITAQQYEEAQYLMRSFENAGLKLLVDDLLWVYRAGERLRGFADSGQAKDWLEGYQEGRKSP